MTEEQPTPPSDGPPPAEVQPPPGTPDAPAGIPAPPPPPPSPLEALPLSASRILSLSFDLLVGGRTELRRGSLYIGLVLLLTVGPLVLLLWGFVAAGHDLVADLTDPRGMSRSEAAGFAALGAPLFVTSILASAGFVVTAVETQALAVAILGSQLAGQPLRLRAALLRSRAVFWRLIRGAIIVGLPLSLLGLVVQLALGGGRENAQGVQLVVTFVETLVGAPFVFLASGIVIGDVGAVEALRRSLRIALAHRRLALVVAFFAALAQYLLLFGLGAGLDVVTRLVEPMRLAPGVGFAQAVAIAVVAAGFVLALGTLQFTVVSIATAPQVVTFMSLTHFTGGLDRAREAADASPAWSSTRPALAFPPDGRPSYWNTPEPARRFRWLTAPLLIGVALGLLTMLIGIVQAANR